jgi:hypothetical protein
MHPMKQTLRGLLAVLGLCVGFVVTTGSADAAAPAPWQFVQVEAIAHSNPDSFYVPVTAYCPAGYTPISGGISGPGPFMVVNEYATYWNNSFSEQIFSLVDEATYVLTAECARADQVGTVQVVSADYASSALGQAGGWLGCPSGMRAIGGGADWNLAGARGVEYMAPTSDDSGWYAAGHSDTAGNSLHVEAYCVDASELSGQLVTQAYPDPTSGSNLQATCPTNARTITGGVYVSIAGSGVDPTPFAGWTQDSFTDAYRAAWHASVPWQLPANSTVYVTAWCVSASIPTLVITAAPPEYTAQTYAHLSFTATDPAGYDLIYNCDLDGVGSGCDTPTGTGYDPVGEGRHVFTVSVRNADGEQVSTTYSWTVDTHAPTATMTGPAQPFTLASSAAVSWTGQDDTGGTGIASFQVRERSAAYSTGFTAWSYPAAWQSLSSLATGVTATGLVPGRDYCFAVRSIDRAGNASPWSSARCIARALDDRDLIVGAGWARGTGAQYWNDTISTSSNPATATRTGAQLDRVGIVATRGPGMGSIAVYAGTSRIGQINLAATSIHYQSLVLLPQSSYRTATVYVKVVSRGKPVQLDGLAISRS